ncbi:MAG: amidohydrolase family protein [Firmicutes bacterium]|nr:amidohydrolase family protein [Bacillota bacterium]
MGLFSSLFKRNNYADKVFVCGNIVTPDEELAGCDAIAVKDGIISFIGTAGEAEELIGPDTERIELDGYLCAGFIDPFADPSKAALDGAWFTLSPGASQAKICSEVMAYLASNPAAEYCLAVGCGMDILRSGKAEEGQEKSSFTAALDEVSGSVPVCIIAEDGINILLNSAALELVRARAGELGLPAITPDFAMDTVFSIDYDSVSKKLFANAYALASKGFTALLGSSANSYFDRIYRSVLTECYGSGLIKQRYYGSMRMYRQLMQPSVIYAMNRDRTACMELGGLINFQNISIRLSSDESSVSFLEIGYLKSLCEELADKGYNVRIEAMDRQSAILAIDILGNLSDSYPRLSFSVLHDQDLSMSERSMIFTGKVQEGSLSHPGELKTSGMDAVVAMTEDNARFIGAQGLIGRIAEGMAADFALFGSDPRLANTAEAFKALKAKRTIIGGETVFDAGTDSPEAWAAALSESLSGIADEL